MPAVRVKNKTVKTGDRVKYIVGGRTGFRPATVVDVVGGNDSIVHLRVGKRVVKNVAHGSSYGEWE